MSLPTNEMLINELAKQSMSDAIDHVRLDAIKYHFQFSIPDDLNLDNFSMSSYKDIAFSEGVYRAIYDIIYEVYVSNQTQQVTNVPASWYDHLKLTLSEKYPKIFSRLKQTIKYKQIVTNLQTIYPNIKVDKPHSSIFKNDRKTLKSFIG